MPQSGQERKQDIMIPWSLVIRAQEEKLLCHRVVKRGNRALWFLEAWVAGLNVKKLLCHRVVKRGIRTLWFLGAWVSGLNMKNYFASEWSREESGHYDSLEPGYQDSIWKLVLHRVVQRHYNSLETCCHGSIGLRGPDLKPVKSSEES